MTALKPYPSYKDTNLPWLGQIPAHWEVKQLKRLFIVTNGSTPCSGVPEYWDGDIVWVTPEDLGKLDKDTLYESGRRITKEGYQNCGTTLAPKGSLILSTRAPIGHLAIAGVEFCTNQGCRSLVFRSTNDVKYFYYLMLSLRAELQARGTGTTFAELGKSKLETIQLSLPPHPEQQVIAAYLDRQTAKIDALIAKKQRLLDLLAEQRAALINQAVTKGLNPAVKMKDTGVAWLGQVPSHWDVKRLSAVSPLLRGHDLTVAQRKEGDVPVYSSSGLVGYHNIAKAKAPGVITGRYGTVGKIYYSEHDFWPMNTSLYVYDFKGNHQRYIYYLLQILPFDAFKGKSAVPGVDRNDLHALSVCQPPTNEQMKIAKYLDKNLDEFDTLATKIETAIARLQEYRAALISSVVTGKVDVRKGD